MATINAFTLAHTLLGRQAPMPPVFACLARAPPCYVPAVRHALLYPRAAGGTGPPAQSSAIEAALCPPPEDPHSNEMSTTAAWHTRRHLPRGTRIVKVFGLVTTLGVNVREQLGSSKETTQGAAGRHPMADPERHIGCCSNAERSYEVVHHSSG